MPFQPILVPALDSILPKVEDFFNGFFANLGTEFAQVAQVNSLDLFFGLGSETLHEFPKSYMMSHFEWQNSSIFLLAPLRGSIAVAGLTLAKPVAEISEKINNNDLGAEWREGYSPVSTKFAEFFNKAISEKSGIEANLAVKETAFLPEDGSQNELLKAGGQYVLCVTKFKLGEWDDLEFYILVSSALATPVLGADFAEAEGFIGAGSSGARVGAGNLDSWTCEQAMITPYPIIAVDKTVGDALDLMVERKLDCLPIEQEGKIVRLVTKNNIEVIRSVFFDAPGAEERISRLMCIPLSMVNAQQKLLSAKANDSVKEVCKIMVKNRLHSIPVLGTTGEFLGMITTHKILDSL